MKCHENIYFQGINVEDAMFKVKLITPGDNLFLKIDSIRNRGPIAIAQGSFTVISIKFQPRENFLECSEEPVISYCLHKYFDNYYGTTDVNNITAKHFAIENIKIEGTEYFYNRVGFIRNKIKEINETGFNLFDLYKI